MDFLHALGTPQQQPQQQQPPQWGDALMMDDALATPTALRQAARAAHADPDPLSAWAAAGNASPNAAPAPLASFPAPSPTAAGFDLPMGLTPTTHGAQQQQQQHHPQLPPQQPAPANPVIQLDLPTAPQVAAQQQQQQQAARKRVRSGPSPVSTAASSVSGSVAESVDGDDPEKLDRRKRRHKATETVRRVRINSLIEEIREVTSAPKKKKTEVLEHALEMLRDYQRLKAMESRMLAAERRYQEQAAQPQQRAVVAPQPPAAQPQAQSLASSVMGSPSTTASIAVWSLDMRIVDANDNFLELTGYTRDEVERRSISGLALSRPDQLGKCMEAMTTLLSGRADTARMHKAVVRKDKSHVWVLSTAVLVDDPVRAKRHVVTVMQRVAPPSAKRAALQN